MVVSAEVLDKVVENGVHYAKKWAEYPNERALWEQRYFAVQGVYASLSESATAYGDFNKCCEVVVKSGHILSVFGLYR